MDGGRAAPLQARLSVHVSVLLLNQTCSSVDRPGGIQLPRCTPSPSYPRPLHHCLSPPPSRASLALPPPFLVPSHTPEALEQSRPTLGNRYSHHHSLSLSDSVALSLAQCLPGQHALLINRVSVGQKPLVGNCGRKWSERWILKLGVHKSSSLLSHQIIAFRLWVHPFPFLLSACLSPITHSHTSRIKVNLSEWCIFSNAS